MIGFAESRNLLFPLKAAMMPSPAMDRPTVEMIDLIESLHQEWIKLPIAVMRDVGPAVQTLGGLLKLTSRETFCPIADIARTARLPGRTTAKHLATLAEHGWIENKGRQRTRHGAPRRTCTIAITKQTNDMKGEYAVLPWWACIRNGKRGKLPWSSKAVLSIVMAQLMKIVSVIEREEGKADLSAGSAEEIWGSIANIGDYDRFRFSLDSLCEKTRLSRPAVIAAKQDLHRRKIIEWVWDERDDGGTATDSLKPRDTFRVKVTPASEGRCYVEY
jgi:hypothetical protein